MRVLDLFCGGGGSAVGIARAMKEAGYVPDIVGVDIKRQVEYPFYFIRSDVNQFLIQDQRARDGFDFIWASPPCQAYSRAAQSWLDNRNLPALIPMTRELLKKSGKPYCIENVPGAPLDRKSIRLCGEMFNLGVIRHRLFETNWPCPEPQHVPHRRAEYVPGRKYKRSSYCSVAGHGGDSLSYKLSAWQGAMGIDWITDRKTLTEAVPPAYSYYIFSEFLKRRLENGQI